MRAYKAYGYGGKQYLSGGQTKLDKNNDGKITSEDFKMLRKLKEMMEGGKMYENGGMFPGRGERLKDQKYDDAKRGRGVDYKIDYMMPTEQQIERQDGFFSPIPVRGEGGMDRDKVNMPDYLIQLQRQAMNSKDPEDIARFEQKLAEYKNSSEYKEDLERNRSYYEEQDKDLEEATARYEGRKAEYDKMREAMRVIMNSRLMD